MIIFTKLHSLLNFSFLHNGIKAKKPQVNDLTIISYLIMFALVLCIASGQILFKLIAVYWKEAGSILSIKVFITVAVAVLLYGLTSLVWILVLRKIELGSIYPFTALVYILVPCGSYLVFHEEFTSQYFVGVAFIIAGIVISLKS